MDSETHRKLNHLVNMPGVSHCTMKRKELSQTLEETGGQLMAHGTLWDIVSKHIGAGVYRVQLQEHKVVYRV